MSADEFAAEGLTPEHVGRRLTIVTPEGITGVLTSWRPTPHDRAYAGIAHLDVAGVDHPVKVRRRRRIRLHETGNDA